MVATLETVIAPPATPSPDFVPTGPDVARMRAVRRFIDQYLPTPQRPVYDSVVIAGGKGITAYTLAARLARSPQFAGRVVVAGPPVEETRQLRNGVSMRGTAADFISYALACPQATFIRQVIGPQAAGQPVATRQTTAIVTVDPTTGRASFSRPTAWQGGRHGLGRPIMYGARNTRIANAVRELLHSDGIVETDEAVASLDDARSLALGKRPLLVNLTTNPTLFGRPAPPITRVTLAAQMALRVRPGGIRRPLTPATCFAPLVHRNNAIDVGYFTPFADPLSPDASWYGLMVAPRRSLDGLDKAREVEILADEVRAVADAVGLEPVDRDVTLFGGMIPAPPLGQWQRSAPGTLEMRSLCTPGGVAYYADGILGGAIGAVIAAEALLRGADPEEAVHRALRRYVWWNDLWWFETTRLAGVVNALVSRPPLSRLALAYPHSWSVNHWASRG
ncbi:MAG: hypothetical protein AB1679_07655 [Actinomycetota bacterium]